MNRPKIRAVPAIRNTVVIVDDQSTGRAILEEIVRSLDANTSVEAFANPIDAVRWAQSHPADLVLVDYQMPDIDGIEFVRRLRNLPDYEHVPMVMVTVHDDQKVRYAALDAGITDFLTKPIDARECLARCRNLLTCDASSLRWKTRADCWKAWSTRPRSEIREREKETLLRLARPANSATRRPATTSSAWRAIRG